MTLKELRKKLGRSQQQVADALHISRQSYSYYENGHRDPDTDTLITLSKYFGVSVDVILGIDDSQFPSLSDTERELLTAFNSLSDENRYKVLGMIRLLQYEQQSQEIQEPSAAG